MNPEPQFPGCFGKRGLKKGDTEKIHTVKAERKKESKNENRHRELSHTDAFYYLRIN